MARHRKLKGTAQIAEAALELIDREGLGALSMRRIAGALDVKPMTLYGYVANREALLDAVHAHLLAQVAIPDRDVHWLDAALAVVRDLRRVLMAHPNTVEVVASRPATQGASLDLLEASLSVVPPPLRAKAPDIVQTLFVFTLGHCSFHASLARTPRTFRIDPARHPAIASAAPSTPKEEFEHGLHILATGLRAYV